MPFPSCFCAGPRGGYRLCRQLFELYRNYLRLIARPMIDGRKLKLDASDLVQETFLSETPPVRGFCRPRRARADGLAAADPGPDARPSGQVPPVPRAQQLAGRFRWRHCWTRPAVPLSSELADSLPSPSSIAVRRERAVSWPTRGEIARRLSRSLRAA